MAVNHVSFLAAQPAEHSGQCSRELLAVDSEKLVFRACRVSQRTQDIEYGPNADLAPGADSVFHRRVEKRCEDETDAGLVQAAKNCLGAGFDIHPDFFQQIGTAAEA